MLKLSKTFALTLITTLSLTTTSSAANLKWCRIHNSLGTEMGCWNTKNACDQVNKSSRNQFTCVAISK